MSEVQNRDRLHRQPETPHPGIPGDSALPADAAEDYAAVRVHVTNPGATGAVQYGSYATIVIPASTATVPGLAQLLPRDPLRQYAYIFPVDYPIIIATTREEAQSQANVGAAYPNGGYLGSGWSPEIRHNEAVFACNTSTAGTCRVVVLAETGPPS